MYSVLRPYVTTGIALTGAGVIAMSPLLAPPQAVPDVHVAAPRIVDNAQLQLTTLGIPHLAAAAQALQLLLSSGPQALAAVLGQLDDIAGGSLPLDQAFYDTVVHLRTGIVGTANGAANLIVAVTGAEVQSLAHIGLGDALVLAVAAGAGQAIDLIGAPLDVVKDVMDGVPLVDSVRIVLANEVVQPIFTLPVIVGIGLNNGLPAPIGGDPDIGDAVDEGLIMPVVRQVQKLQVAVYNAVYPSQSQPFVQQLKSGVEVNSAEIEQADAVTLDTAPHDVDEPRAPRTPKLVDRLANSTKGGNKVAPGVVGGHTKIRAGLKDSGTGLRTAVNDLGTHVDKAVKKLTGADKAGADEGDSNTRPAQD